MKLAPKIAMSDDFLRSFAAIPRDHQQAVLGFLAKFRHNPMATGINYEKLSDGATPNMHSVRMGDNYRGIVLKPDMGNVYCLLWVDRHDDAYEWARRHRVEIHPDLGSIQVFAVEEVQAEAEPQHTPPQTAGDTTLFAALKDREIRRLGVPADKLPLVRAVQGEAVLDSLEHVLPDEAFEALFMFAAGESYEKIVADLEAPERIDTSDFGAALERDASKRHFVVLTDDSDVQALMAAPLERWRVFLHPSQRKLVERTWSGPVKVTGGAGTGKTVVAMHRAAYLARLYKDLPGKPIIFTTFTKTLADDIRQHVRQICTPQEYEKIQVVHLDQWAVGLLRRFGYKQDVLYDEEERCRLWQAAMAALPESVTLSRPFVRAEYERVVLPQGCETAEEYMRARRVGRGGQLSRAQRKAIWPVFAEYREQLRAADRCEPESAFHDTCSLIRRESAALGIRCMIVDEGQDISAAAFELIRTAVPVAENDLFIVGDAHQRIYRHRVVLGRVGIEVRGRSRTLRVNYRTTDEIRRWACAQLEGCTIDDLDGDMASWKGYRSLTHGSPPEILTSASVAEDIEHIRGILRQGAEDDIAYQQVCITARTNKELAGYADALQQQGIAQLKLDRDTADDQKIAGVRLATMHRIKGIEFSVVVLAGYRSPHAYAETFARDEDAGVTEETETAERCLLHVAATRAREHVYILQRPNG